MKVVDVDGMAHRLDEAVRQSQCIPMLSLEDDVSEEDAYHIQRAGIGFRLLRGEHVVGMKMGLTSRAKMKQMGVERPIYGYLTDVMQVSDGGVLRLSHLSHPRVEPEVAFILGRELRGPVTVQQAWEAVAWVCPALEVLDSRYRDFKFNLADVVADNASSAHFVLGPGIQAAQAPPLDCLGIVMQIDGHIVQTGSSAAVYEHPLRSLQLQAHMLAQHGGRLQVGHVVLSGGATEAVPIKPGSHVRVSIERLGDASFHTRP